MRHAFILPRDKILDSSGAETDHAVSLVDHVFPEFGQIARSRGIKRHQCKPVTRNYMYHFEVAATQLCPNRPCLSHRHYLPHHIQVAMTFPSPCLCTCAALEVASTYPSPCGS